MGIIWAFLMVFCSVYAIINGRANEFILAAFNFHRDISVSTNELDSIISILNNWDIYGCESKEITKLCQ